MSSIIYEDEQFKVNVFHGGHGRGPCLQITMQECHDHTLLGAAQVDLGSAIQLYNTLGTWIKDECLRRQKLLREEIRDLREFEKTVFHEVAHLKSSLIGNNTLAAEYILKFAPTRKVPEWEAKLSTEHTPVTVQEECLGEGKCTDQGCPTHYA